MKILAGRTSIVEGLCIRIGKCRAYNRQTCYGGARYAAKWINTHPCLRNALVLKSPMKSWKSTNTTLGLEFEKSILGPNNDLGSASWWTSTDVRAWTWIVRGDLIKRWISDLEILLRVERFILTDSFDKFIRKSVSSFNFFISTGARCVWEKSHAVINLWRLHCVITVKFKLVHYAA